MISFMVIGAPRSGTAWVSNWLTTERTLCLHDALFTHDIEDLDKISHDRPLGLADTGLALRPEWVQAHTARKVILHRDQVEIEASLAKAGLPSTAAINWHEKLNQLDGLHVHWRVMFERPHIIHTYLFGDEIPFDAVRHAVLAKLNVQVDFDKIDPDPIACARMVERFDIAVRRGKTAL